MRLLETVRWAVTGSPARPSGVTAALPLAGVLDPSTYPIASPWSSSNLQRVIFEDVYGSDIPVNTRQSAMRIPSVSRARRLLCTTISRLPLVQLGVDEEIPQPEHYETVEEYRAARAEFRRRQPTWLYRSTDGTSPQHKMLWTVDDQLFYGWSCWWRSNAARSDGGFPLSTGRIPFGEWSINADNRVVVRGVPVDDESIILLPGVDAGLLTEGYEVLRDARTLYGVVRQRLASPVPPIDLHQEEGDPLTEEQIDTLIDRWVTARNNPSLGGVGYTSKGIKANVLAGTDDGALMIDARNAAAVDLARAIGISAGMIDATAPKASLNYETTTGRNQEFVDIDLRQYTAPIEWRLSMDDCSPQGKRVAFDFSDYTAPIPSPTGPAVQD